VRRWWRHCPSCARGLVWDDSAGTETTCDECGWSVAPSFAWCPWCGTERDAEPVALRAPRGFRLDVPCDYRCGGRVQYPMEHCPTCGRVQGWNEEKRYEGNCAACLRGVDDWMDWCPWCGQDATGQDRIQRALTRARRLLLVSRIRPWDYRVLLRPGISGVDPRFPTIVEIDRRYAAGRRRDEIPWPMLTGLIVHELGHSFLYHHWEWARSARFRSVFGEVTKAYRVRDDGWVDFQRRRVAVAPTDHVSLYAAEHPEEDFAETFRFFVARHGRLRDVFADLGRKHKGVVVYEKFLVLRDYVREVRGRK